MEGLHALGDMVVTRAHALAARAVIPDPFAEHHDLLRTPLAGPAPRPAFPEGGRSFDATQRSPFFQAPAGCPPQATGILARFEAGRTHVMRPGRRKGTSPCHAFRQHVRRAARQGPAGNAFPHVPLPARQPGKDSPVTDRQHRAASTHGQRTGKPIRHKACPPATVPAGRANGAVRAAIPDSRPAGQAARPGPAPVPHRPGCRYAAGRGRPARGRGRSRPRAA